MSTWTVEPRDGEPKTHNYKVHMWGHGVSIWDTKDEGLTATAMGHGRDLRPGDFMLVPNGERDTRYRVDEVEYFFNPPDMWKATLSFAPRPKATGA